MALTGRLGTSDSRLGQFHLGDEGSGGANNPLSSLVLSQGVSLSKTLNISVSQTLTMTSSALHITPLTAVVGYSGGLTRYAFVIDVTNNVPLYELNQDTVFDYMASTTKLMTAYLLMQYKSTVLDTEYVTFTTADVTAPYTGASSAGFMAGDICNWRDILYALFMDSSFEACQIIGRIIGTLIYTNAGSTGLTGLPRFIQAMNSTATTLGMTNTNYVECSGLSRIGSTINNTSTARDISTICGAAFAYSAIQLGAGTVNHTVTVTGPNARSISMSAYNRFINGPTFNQSGISDPNILGGKNGNWTDSGVDHFSLSQVWVSPTGAKVVITVLNSETLYALTLDQQGLIYSLLRDFPYLKGTLDADDFGDPSFSNVKLLMGFDGSIADEIVPSRALSTSGTSSDAGIIADSSGSVDFSGSTNYVKVTNNDSDLIVTNNDCTIEVWFQAGGSIASESIWFCKADTTVGATREWAINELSGNFRIFVSTDGTNWSSAVAWSISSAERAIFFNGAPRHLALVQQSGVWSYYLNGEKGTTTLTGTPLSTTARLSLGYWSASGVSPLGDHDDFRMTVGNARYTANKEYLSGLKFPRYGTSDRTVSQSLTLSQSATCSHTTSQSVSQSLSLTSSAAHPIFETPSQTLSLSQTVSYLNYVNKSASSSLALTHTVAVSITANLAVYHTVVAHQTIGLLKTLNLDQVQLLSISQAPTGVDTKLATSTLTFTQSATVQLVHTGKNTLEITQVVKVSTTLNLHLFSDFIPFQVYNTTNTLKLSVPQPIALVQTVSVQHVKFVSTPLTLTQSTTAVKCKPGFSTLSVLDLASLTKSLGQPVSQALSMIQSTSVQKSWSRSTMHAFGMNQTVRATKVLTAFAGNILSLGQSLWRDLHVEATPQTLTLTSTAVGNKTATPIVQQALALSQAVHVSTTLVRAVNHALVFQPTFQKYIGVTNNPYVSVPTLQYTVVSKVRNTILEGNGLAIVLPSPEFGDKEAPPLKVNIKRSMNGVRRAYVRTVSTAQLTYDFIVDRLKAIELRQFILANDASLIKMTNFKGEIWMVQITNNPVVFTEVALWQSPWGNKSSATLEFEGVRIN